MAHPRHLALVLFWILCDAALFVAAYALAYGLRIGWYLSSDFLIQNHIIAALLAAVPLVGILLLTRTFALPRDQRSLRNNLYIFFAVMMGLAAYTLTYYFLYQDLFSRLLMLQCFVASLVFVWLNHQLFSWLQCKLLSKNPVYRVLIVGVTRESKQLIKDLVESCSPLVPVAILDARGAKEADIEGVPVKGKLNKLEDVLKGDRITHLIQCSDLEHSLNLLSACRRDSIAYHLLPSVLGMVEGDERLELVAGIAMTSVLPSKKRWEWFIL